jgi:Domain of unknown function (DUF4349)
MTRFNRLVSKITFGLALAALTGCGGSAEMAKTPSASQPGYPTTPADAPPASPPPAPAANAGASVAATPATTPAPSPKNAAPIARTSVIIYHGAVRMQADEDVFPKTIDHIIDLAESMGGQLAARRDDSVEVKVPSASFRDFLGRVDGLGGVTSRSVSADDVSEEFNDLEVRLKNLRATRTRLQDLMGKSPNVADTLAVERELERVAQEIDRIEGRLEFLRAHAAMSTIDVTLVAKPKTSNPVVSGPAHARVPEAPVSWVSDLGVEGLLSLHH